MRVNIKIPELTKPHLVEKLSEFVNQECKKISCEASIETHKASRVKLKFIEAWDYPYNWVKFIKQINSILELDKC